MDKVETLPSLPPREAGANKGNFGRVLVIAGSRGMAGAAVLCAGAALRGGAGLVRLAIPESILTTVAAANPCYLTAPLPEDTQGRFSRGAKGDLLELARSSDAAAVGPGLGKSEELTELVLALVEQTETPLVIDADGLNVVRGQTQRLRNRKAPLVLTPHPGEFARLTGSDVPTVQADRAGLAARFAAENQLILVLKGQGTVVTDGRRVHVNRTGNPGMATGGTGDVLTGLIAALIGQGLEAFAAAQLGAHLHGRAGDLARDDLGEVSLIASDLLDYLPRAFRALSSRP